MLQQLSQLTPAELACGAVCLACWALTLRGLWRWFGEAEQDRRRGFDVVRKG
jgi:hypothetical protein